MHMEGLESRGVDWRQKKTLEGEERIGRNSVGFKETRMGYERLKQGEEV